MNSYRHCLAVLLTGGVLFGSASVAANTGLPDFQLTDLQGNSRDTQQFRGRWLVLNHWATWCAPCREELPELSQIDRQYEDVSVLGLAWEEQADNALITFLKLLDVRYPVVQANPSEPPPPFIQPEVMPTTLLYGPDGQLVQKWAGRLTLSELLSAMSKHSEVVGAEGGEGHGNSLDPTIPRGDCNDPRAQTDLRHCLFSGHDLEGVDLTGSLLDGVDLTNAKMAGCRLTGASLVGADLKWADLVDCVAEGADFSQADLFHATFDGGKYPASLFREANMFGANLNEVEAARADFSGAYMKDIAMEDSGLQGSLFIQCFMQRAVLIGSRLQKADLSQATLSGAALEESDFSEASLHGALVNGARLDHSSFDGADLKDARFVNSVLAGATFEAAVNIPPHLAEMLDRESGSH